MEPVVTRWSWMGRHEQYAQCKVWMYFESLCCVKQYILGFVLQSCPLKRMIAYNGDDPGHEKNNDN